jgi:hypothetical protein
MILTNSPSSKCGLFGTYSDRPLGKKPLYYALISRFKEKTGCGVLVNTSFNLRGEPAIFTFKLFELFDDRGRYATIFRLLVVIRSFGYSVFLAYIFDHSSGFNLIQDYIDRVFAISALLHSCSPFLLNYVGELKFWMLYFR